MTGVQTCALPICFPVTIDKKDDPKTPEELNAEITKENKELEDLATESGIDLKPLQSLNRVYKNTKNALDKYNNEDKPTPEAKAKLKDLVGILKDELEQVEELYEDLVADEKKPLDAKVDKKFKEIISKSKALVTQADKTLKTKTSKTEDDVVDDEGVVVEFPNYFQNLYRGSIDSPIEGLDYTVNSEIEEALKSRYPLFSRYTNRFWWDYATNSSDKNFIDKMMRDKPCTTSHQDCFTHFTCFP